MSITSFKAPTAEEREHDFLWRIAKRVPAAGMIGIFDRSHYEDVLIARVRELAPADEIERRYGAINDFEQQSDRRRDDGHQVLPAHQLGRAEGAPDRATRGSRPSTGSTTPATSTSGSKWDDYQQAYAIALERCNTDHAPWYVIPADRKWYRNWAITHPSGRAPPATSTRSGPQADFDVDVEKARVAAT